MLFVALSGLVAGCATTNIPNVRVYKEIPFIDGAEGVYVDSASLEEGELTQEQWQDKRPYLISIDPEGWSAIKAQWYEACRVAGPKCNQQVDSIDSLIRRLDDIARMTFGRNL